MGRDQGGCGCDIDELRIAHCAGVTMFFAGASMRNQFRWLIVSGALLIAGMLALWTLERRPARLGPALPVVAEVGQFAVTNQAGERLDAGQLRGHIHAVNLFFTRCPGPCVTLTGIMRTIQDRLPAGSKARLMSVSSDPEFDTPEVLRAYAARFGVDSARWHLVTGTRDEIRRLATQQLLLVLQDKTEDERESENDLFLHSTLIVLIDQQGRLRGGFEAFEPGAADRILAAIRQLEGGK